MRIMHLSRMALTFTNFMHPVILEQKRRGHYVCVSVPEGPETKKLRNMEIDIFTNNMERSLSPLNIIKAILRIRKILNEQQIDVLICHSNLTSSIGRIAAWLAKTKFSINFCHGFTCLPVQNPINWYLLFFIEKILGRITDAMVVMNDYDENLCKTKRILRNPAMVLRIPGMGVNLDKFTTDGVIEAKQKVCEEFDLNANDKIIFSVTRLIPNKGVFIFLEAARIICEKRNDIRFMIAGIGRSKSKLEAIIKDNGMEDKFKLLGWRNDVYMLTKAADVFVLPTFSSEGLPVSILEAMSCAKPVVATQYRGCEDEIVDRQSGFLVPIKNAEAIAEKILLLSDDEQLRLSVGAAARKRVEQHFEIEYCTNKIVDVLEKAVHG